MWIFLCHCKIWTSAEQSPCWCKGKCACYACLSREQPGSQSRGICCVWGLPFRLPARGWIHGAFSVCAALTGTAASSHQRHELRTQRRALVSWRHPRSTVKIMRLQRSPGLVDLLWLATFMCVCHSTTAIDIPLEGECWLELLYISNEHIFTKDAEAYTFSSVNAIKVWLTQITKNKTLSTLFTLHYI